MAEGAVTMATAIARNRYMELVGEFPLRPIRTAAMYNAAQKMMTPLAMRDERSLDKDERDYLSVLIDLIDAYDRSHAPMPTKHSTPSQRLKHLLEQSETSPSDLQRILEVSQAA